MKSIKLLSVLFLAAVIGFTSCKPKDSDIEKSVKEALAKMPDAAGTSVAVKDGVVTLTGECKDEACKTGCATALTGIKGVKSVTNNCTVKPVVVAPASTTTSSADLAVQKQVTDVLTNIKTLTVAFMGQKAIFAGSCTPSQKLTVTQACNSAKLGADMSKVSVK